MTPDSEVKVSTGKSGAQVYIDWHHLDFHYPNSVIRLVVIVDHSDKEGLYPRQCVNYWRLSSTCLVWSVGECITSKKISKPLMIVNTTERHWLIGGSSIRLPNSVHYLVVNRIVTYNDFGDLILEQYLRSITSEDSHSLMGEWCCALCRGAIH